MKSTQNTLLAYGKSTLSKALLVAGAALTLAACATRPAPPPSTFSQDRLPVAIRVPAGNVVAYETTAVGFLNYECRANTPSGWPMGWTLVSPGATLYDREGRVVGNFLSPPQTFTMSDGSSVTGEHIDLSPVVGEIHIPLQLLKGTPGAAPGILQNVTYIQRVNTKNGQDFVSACTAAEVGQKVSRPYQADYIFWKAV